MRKRLIEHERFEAIHDVPTINDALRIGSEMVRSGRLRLAVIGSFNATRKLFCDLLINIFSSPVGPAIPQQAARTFSKP